MATSFLEKKWVLIVVDLNVDLQLHEVADYLLATMSESAFHVAARSKPHDTSERVLNTVLGHPDCVIDPITATFCIGRIFLAKRPGHLFRKYIAWVYARKGSRAVREAERAP